MRSVIVLLTVTSPILKFYSCLRVLRKTGHAVRCCCFMCAVVSTVAWLPDNMDNIWWSGKAAAIAYRIWPSRFNPRERELPLSRSYSPCIIIILDLYVEWMSCGGRARAAIYLLPDFLSSVYKILLQWLNPQSNLHVVTNTCRSLKNLFAVKYYVLYLTMVPRTCYWTCI